MLEVPLEDLRSASELLVRALLIRKKYMNMSSQQFPSVTERFLRQLSPPQTTTDETSTTNIPDTTNRTGSWLHHPYLT